jgi:HAD superfamily hydrolase (TIGR01509 family)
MGIKAVIFNFDQVLVKSYTDHINAFLIVAKKFGYKLKKEEICKRFGRSGKEILQELLPNATENEIKNFMNEKEENYRKIISKKTIQPMKGMRELFVFLKKKKIKCAISSSASIKNILIVLRKTKLKRYFKTIVAAEHVKHHKPHPEPLLKAAKLLKIRPTNCIYIGDSIFEMQAARRARMIGIGILTGIYNSNELKRNGASYIVNDMREVKSLLQRLLK